MIHAATSRARPLPAATAETAPATAAAAASALSTPAAASDAVVRLALLPLLLLHALPTLLALLTRPPLPWQPAVGFCCYGRLPQRSRWPVSLLCLGIAVSFHIA